jgi:hypothetical protein
METEETAPQQQTTKYRDGSGSRSINTCTVVISYYDNINRSYNKHNLIKIKCLLLLSFNFCLFGDTLISNNIPFGVISGKISFISDHPVSFISIVNRNTCSKPPICNKSLTTFLYKSLTTFIYKSLTSFIYKSLRTFIHKSLTIFIHKSLTTFTYKSQTNFIYKSLTTFIYKSLTTNIMQ